MAMTKNGGNYEPILAENNWSFGFDSGGNYWDLCSLACKIAGYTPTG
jgi:hypothetical protein